MAIRRIGEQENIVLDQQNTQSSAPNAPQSRIRKLAPNENITLDADRAVLTPRAASPVYYPQQEADTSISGHLKAGATDAARRAYGFSANVLDKVADAVDSAEAAVVGKYYDIVGHPEQDPMALDTIQAPEGNIISRALRRQAEQDMQAERELAGRGQAMNVQDTVAWDQISPFENDLTDIQPGQVGRFILEQGARSAPEMAAAFVPVIGMPVVAATTSQNILENRFQNNGMETTEIPSNDDMKAALAAGVVSAGLERVGILGDVAQPFGGTATRVTSVGQLPGAMARSGAGEAATEFFQEGTEYVGGTAGTDVDVTGRGFVESGLQGALVGGPMGASIRGGTEGAGLAYDAAKTTIKNRRSSVEQAAAEGQTQQKMGSDQSEQASAAESEIPIDIVSEKEFREETGDTPIMTDANGTVYYKDGTAIFADGTVSRETSPVAQVDVPLNRDDLAAAINNDTPLPERKTVDLPDVAIDPVLRDMGYNVGGTVEQVNTESGEVLIGTVTAAQMIDGNLEVTVLEPTGGLRTLFASDGAIRVTTPLSAPPPAAAAEPANDIEAMRDMGPAMAGAIGENFINGWFDTLSGGQMASSAFKSEQKWAETERAYKNGQIKNSGDLRTFLETGALRPAERSGSDLESMSLEDLTKALQGVKNQAKNTGWNARLMKRRDKLTEQLNARFPEWDVPANVDVVAAAEDVAPEPTDAQKEAGNYKKGHVSVQGLNISLENPKGSIRSGRDANGQEWQVEMPAHYGYIRKTEGADGDHVDVYIGDNPSSDTVFIIDQIDPDTKKFDEHKVMIGFRSLMDAANAYAAAFSDGRGAERRGSFVPLTMAEFKEWLKNGDNKKPYFYDEPEAETPPTSAEQANETSNQETGDTTKPISYTESKTDPSKSYRIESPISGEARDVNVIGDEKRGYAIVDGINIIDITAMIKAGFSIERAIAQSLSTDPESLSAKKPEPEQAQTDQQVMEKQNENDLFDTAQRDTAEQDGSQQQESAPAQPPSDAANEPAADPAGPEQSAVQDQQSEQQQTAPEAAQVKQGEVGMKLAEGEIVLTSTGRQTTPFPRIGIGTPRKVTLTVRRIQDWLLQNALAEARARGDEFNARQFEAELNSKSDEYPQATLDGAEIYLFDADSVQSVRRSSLNDLYVPPQQDSSAPAQDTTNTPAEQAPQDVAPDPVLDEGGAETQNVTSPAPSADESVQSGKRKQKLKDVGEKLEGGRKFKEQFDKAEASEQAKLIIETTKPSVAFAYTAPERQTTGAARFHQEFVKEIRTFSEFLYDRGTLAKGRGGRWSVKMPSWQEQVKSFLADNPEGDPVVLRSGDSSSKYSADLAAQKKRDIIQAAQDYIDFATRVNEIFENAATVQELRIEFKDAFEDKEFSELFRRFTGSFSTNGLQRDIITENSWSVFGRLTDESAERQKSGPEKKLIRPRLESIQREDLPDYRAGKDITPEEFKDTFGFRGVEFGNWVNASEGQAHVNHAYDALMDLSKRLGIRAKDISIGGKLGFAFGARGSGEHAAHYEPDTNVINLTKTKGDGSVAHEWAHALDINMRKVGAREKAFMDSAYSALSKRVITAEQIERKVTGFLKGSLYYKGDKAAGPIGNARKFLTLMQQHPGYYGTLSTQFQKDGNDLGKDYWGTSVELFARAWEAWIYDTLPGRSPYLVNPWVADGAVTKESGYRGTIYPRGDERRGFNEMYEAVIKGIEFTDDGVRLKADAKLPFENDLATVIKAAKDLEGRLGQMMKEIDDGSVQQGEVSPSVSSGAGERGSGYVPPDDAGQDAENAFEGDGAGGGAELYGPDAASQGQSEDGRRAGKERGDGDRVSRDDTVPAKSDIDAAPEPFEAKGQNHVISMGDLSETRSQKQKAEDNIRIIKLVKRIEAERRAATPEEQVTIAKFTGWGSIKNAFPDGEGKAKEGWGDIVKQVKDILTDEEYRQSRRTIQYAHYTSEIVTRSMWQAMKRFGLKTGNVFEPGMGIGNFIGMKPQDMELQYSGLEVDPMSARIAAILYPESGVRNADFISAQYADGMFDAAIGNPPFSDTKVKSDKRYKGLSLHNYFFAKTLDMVADGGVIAFVTSRYSMDALDTEARKALADKADLIGAIRLPNTAFKTNAHTEVVTDIIFLRKRRKGEESNGVAWTETKEIALVDAEGKPFQVNEYFVNNPEMVLGDFSSEGSMYAAKSLTVVPPEAKDLQQQLDEAIGRLPENVITEIDRSSTVGLDMSPPESKDGSYYVKDGALMQVENGIGQPAPMRGKAPGGLTRDEAEKVKKLIPVRDALRETLDAMVSRDDGRVKKAQKELRKHYDAFVKKYGPITKSETKSRPAAPSQLEEARDEMRNDYLAAGEDFNEGDIDLSGLLGKTNPDTGKRYTPSQIAKIRSDRREAIEAAGGVVDEGDFDPSMVPDNVTITYPNMDAFRADPEYYNFIVLENYDADTDTATTTEVFEKNIVREVAKPKMETSVDALNYSLAQKNGVDIDFMSLEAGIDRATLIRELEELDLIYSVPTVAGSDHFIYAEEYLSGLVRDKLRYAQRLAETDPKYKRNVEALEAVQPRDIPASDINTQFGSPYFTPDVIQDFMEKELNIHAKVTYSPIINGWEVSAYDKHASENTSVHGTAQKNADDLMASMLMRKEIKVTRRVNTEDGEKTIVDVNETQAAQDKARAMQEKFDSWIWKSDHGEKVHRRYNQEFNNIVPRKVDGKHITVASSIPLREHQKNAVWRVLQTGNTYLAHAVGAGKTLAMVSMAMEMRRLGQWKKPMFVVPNHMLAQFAGEFRAAYPQAKIFVADERNFHTDRRQRFIANVAKGDWDGVVMTYSSFKKIPISKEFEAEMINAEIDRYRLALEEANKNKSGGRGSTAARIEKQIEKMESRLKGLKTQDVDQGFSFDQLGTDAILLDEAHYFRKLSFPTMQGNMKGVNPIGSKAAWDLYAKTKYLDTVHPGRNLVMASGTPLTNTLAEVFTIQRFMRETALEARNIATFDAWSSVYAASVTNAERQPSGAYKNVTRLAEFRNLNSLSQMVREFMDVVTSDELGALVDRPTMKTGTMIIKTTAPTREYLAFQKFLADRTAEVAKSGRQNEKGADNILSIINEGRHAAIDMRLIDPTLPEKNSKLEDMISNIYRVYKDTSTDEFTTVYKGSEKSAVKGGVQLVFSDLGVRSRTKDGVSFSAYDHIRRKLIRLGIPSDEIAFIADYDTTEEKRRLQAKVRSGEIRVLIGSTAKMGTGLNVQNRLKAVHNLDAPWLPADLEQRTGRALRQGNQYGEIEIYGYGTEGSYDSTMWGMLETKAKAIIQFLKGDGDLTTMRDIEETDHFRMAKAMTSGDTRVLKQAELESEVEKLARQAKNFTNEQVTIRSGIASNKNNIEYKKQLIKDVDAAVAKKVDFEAETFQMSVSGVPYDERAEAGEALEKAVQAIIDQKSSTPTDGVKIADFRGFEVRMFASVSNLESDYEMFMTDPAFNDSRSNKNTWKDGEKFSGSGAITRLNNAINRLPGTKEDAIFSIQRSEREIKVLESQIAGDFPKQDELRKKRDELIAIEKDLKENAPVEVVYDDYPLDYWRANKEAVNAANNNNPSFKIVGDEEFTYGKASIKKRGPAETKLQERINKRLQDLGWPGAAVRLEANLDRFGVSGVEGAYWEGLIYISMQAKDILGTLNHEIIHALKAAGAFTAAEWSILEGRAKAWREKYNIDATYRDVLREQGIVDPALLEAKLNEEAIAHAFQDMSNQGIVRRLANKAVRFIKAIGEVLRGRPYNYTTAEDVFDAIERGYIGERIPSAPVKRETAGQTSSPTFRNWFRDSKVVDSDGKPLVVYHGTNADISEFSPDKMGSATDAPSAKQGFFFASDPAVASSYAVVSSTYDQDNMIGMLNRATKGAYEQLNEWLLRVTKSGSANPSGGNVMPVYLSIQNPLIVDFKGKRYREKTYNDIITEAKEKGHDGVILRNTFDEGFEDGGGAKTDIFVTFKPSQIKSIHNRGDFDPFSNKIMYSVASDNSFPMYKLGKAKGPALKAATETLSNVRGLDRSLLSDLKRISSIVLHPQQIATLYKDFTPVYRAVIERFKQREVLMHQFAKPISAYNKLNAVSKKNVNAVLELGRLKGATFKPDASGAIIVKNHDQPDAVHSKEGDTITLTPAEAAAYLGVRKAMDMALDKYLETILEEFGLLELGARTIQDVEKMRLDAVNRGMVAEVRRFKEILQRLNDVMDAKRRGYVPFKRWGEIGISVKDADGTLLWFERVELPKDWRKKGTIGENKVVQDAIERLGKKFNSPDIDINFFEMSKFDQVSAYLDLRNLDILASSSEMSESDYARLRDMLEREMQKKGFRSHFFGSKNVPGYSEDFERAINDYVVTISSYISRRLHEKKIDAAVGAISEAGKSNLYEYARNYQQYVNDPIEEFAAIRMMGFFWYLAGNISSGLVNLTQPLIVTAPWFKAKFSHAQIGKALSKAYADVAKIFDVKDLAGEAFDFERAPADVRSALIKAYEEGDFLSMATHDAMAISNSNTQALRGLDKKRRAVADAISLTFSIPEKINRIATFVAAYRLALDPKNRKKIETFIKSDALGRSMLEGKASAEEFAFAYAEYAVISTQYRVGKINRPKLTRGPGSMMFQFWSFMMQTFELMYKLAKVHGGQSKMALAIMILSIVAVAGLKGLPFEDDMQDLIEALYKFGTGKDLDIDTLAREAIVKHTGSTVLAEAIINGLPAALMNVDLSGRLGFGNIAPDSGMDFLGVWWDMLIERPLRAAEFASQGEMTRAIAEVAPAFLRNPLQSYLWTEDGVRTQTGKKVIDAEDVTGTDAALKFFGFTSADISRERARGYATDRASKAVDELRSRYYSRIAKAIAERKRLYDAGDTAAAEELTRTIEAIQEERVRHNAASPMHEQIILHPPTLKQKVKEELSGAEASRVRKQARPRAAELKEIYGD